MGAAHRSWGRRAGTEHIFGSGTLRPGRISAVRTLSLSKAGRRGQRFVPEVDSLASIPRRRGRAGRRRPYSFAILTWTKPRTRAPPVSVEFLFRSAALHLA